MIREQKHPFPPIDALLVHSMGHDETGERPHLRGLSIVWAAVYLAYDLGIPELVFTGQHYWGETEVEPIGFVTGREAILNLEEAHIPCKVTRLSYRLKKQRPSDSHRKIYDTPTEIDAYLDYCQQSGIKNVASISSETHVISIQQLYQLRGVQAQVLAAERVLSNIPGTVNQDFYTQTISAIRNSDDEKGFQKREAIKRRLYFWTGRLGEYLLSQRACSTRQISTQHMGWSVTITGRE